MATLSRARVLGSVGSILVFIPFVSLVGYVLIIVAVKEISDGLQDGEILHNVLVAALTGIVGAIAGAFAILSGANVSPFALGLPATVSFAVGLLIAWVFLVASATFLRRAYASMAQRLGVATFGTAAKAYLAGAALTIVLVGFVLLLIAQILQAIAYLSIPAQPLIQGADSSPASMATGWPWKRWRSRS